MTAAIAHLTPRSRIGQTTVTPSAGLVYAKSADTVWTYERQQDDGLWLVTHDATGLEMTHRTLLEARQWTATPAAILELRAMAADLLVAPFVLPDDQRQAHRALMVFAGTLLPAATDVDSRCECGGYLTLQRGVRYLHVNTCPECQHQPDEPCPDGMNTHKVCYAPAPVECDHRNCHKANNLSADCDLGHGTCCGEHHS